MRKTKPILASSSARLNSLLLGLLCGMASLAVGVGGGGGGTGTDRSISIGVAPLPREVQEEAGFNAAESAGVFVGINEFEDTQIPPLKYAVDDAIDQAHRFWELGLIQPARIHLCLSGKPAKNASAQRLETLRKAGIPVSKPGFTNLLGKAGDAARYAGEKGILVFTISTHGYYIGTDALIVSDTRFDPNFLGKTLEQTSITHTMLFEKIRQGKCPRKLIVIDACREPLVSAGGTRSLGAATSMALPPSLRKLLDQSRGMAILLATSSFGFGYDGGLDLDNVPIENGVFTHFLLKGLEGEAAGNEQGVITIGALADYLQKQIIEWVHQYRPDHKDKSYGIGIDGDKSSEGIPLAINRSRFTENQAWKQRREKAEVILRTFVFDGVIESGLAAEIRIGLNNPDRDYSEAILEKIELLSEKKPAYTAREFSEWWERHKRQEARTQASVVPAPLQAARTYRSAGTTWEDWFFEPLSWIVLLLILLLLVVLLYLMFFRKRTTSESVIVAVPPMQAAGDILSAAMSRPSTAPALIPAVIVTPPSPLSAPVTAPGADPGEELRRVLNALAGRPQSFECRLLVQLHNDAPRGASDAEPSMRGFMALERHSRYRARIGDRLQFIFQASEDCYLTLVDLGTSGRVTIIYPNWHQRGERVSARHPLLIPPVSGRSFDYVIAPPAGEELIMALATREPMDAFSPSQWAELEQSIVYQPDRHVLSRDIQVVKTSFPRETGANGWSLSSCRIEIVGH